MDPFRVTSTTNNNNFNFLNPHPHHRLSQSQGILSPQEEGSNGGWSFSTRNCLICNVPFIGKSNEGQGQSQGPMDQEEEEDFESLRQGAQFFYKLFELEGDPGHDFPTLLGSNPSSRVFGESIIESTGHHDPTRSFCISCSFKVGNLVQLWRQAEEIQRLIHGVQMEVFQILQRTLPQIPSATTIYLIKAKILETSASRNVENSGDRPALGTGTDKLDSSHVSMSQSQPFRDQFENSRNRAYASPAGVSYPPVFSNVDHVQVERRQESLPVEVNSDDCRAESPTSPTPASPIESVYNFNENDKDEFSEKSTGADSSLSEHQSSEPSQIRRSQRARLPRQYCNNRELAICMPSRNQAMEDSAVQKKNQTVSKRKRGRPKSKATIAPSPGDVEQEILSCLITKPNSDNDVNANEEGQQSSNSVDTSESSRESQVELLSQKPISEQPSNEESETVRAKRTKQSIKEVHKCQICLRNLTSALSLKNHHRVHTGEKPFKCTYCDRRFADNCNKKKHEDYMHQQSTRLFKCEFPNCDRSSNRQDTIYAHMKFKHKGFKVIYRDVQCEICGMYLKGNRSLKNHLAKHDGVTYPCKICGKPIKGMGGQMRKHLRTHNPRNLERAFAYKCTNCSMTFASKNLLRKHMLNEHDADSRCVKGIQVVNKLVKKYTCAQCPGVFYLTPMGLKDHIRKGHEVGYNKARALAREATLTTPTSNPLGPESEGSNGTDGHDDFSKEQEEKESEEPRTVPCRKEYPCPVENCKRTFQVLMNLQRHLVNQHPNCDIDQITHKGKRIKMAYRCDECASCPPFPCESDRIKHYELIHSEGTSAFNPFKCPHENCDEEFVFLWELRIHVEYKHPKFKLETFILDRSIPILYTCLECPESTKYIFNGAAGLRRHMEKVHSSITLPELQCPACSLPFKLLNELQRHFTEFHKTKDDKHIIESLEGRIPLQIVCENCPAAPGFPTMKKLHEHMLLGQHRVPLRGVPSASFKCPNCDLNLSLRHLIYHFEIHHNGSTNDVVQLEWLRFSIFNRCLECDAEPFTTKTLLEAHMRDFHYFGPGFKCLKCPEPKSTFRFRPILDLHMADVHGDSKLTNPVIVTLTRPEVSQSCDQPALTSKELVSTDVFNVRPQSQSKTSETTNTNPMKIKLLNSTVDGPEQFKCPEPQCGLTWKTIKPLRQHFTEWHPQSQINTVTAENGTTYQLLYPCTHCFPQQKFPDKIKLNLHLRVKHKLGTSDPERVHRNNVYQNLTCPESSICGTAEASFMKLTALRLHFLTEHRHSKNNKILYEGQELRLTFICDQCPNFRSFRQLGDLQKHVRCIHETKGMKPFELRMIEFESSDTSESEPEPENIVEESEGPDLLKSQESSSAKVPTLGPWNLRRKRVTNYSAFLEDPEEENIVESTTPVVAPPKPKSKRHKPSSNSSPSKSPLQCHVDKNKGHPEPDPDPLPGSTTDQIEIKYESFSFSEANYQANSPEVVELENGDEAQPTPSPPNDLPIPIDFEPIFKTEGPPDPLVAEIEVDSGIELVPVNEIFIPPVPQLMAVNSDREVDVHNMDFRRSEDKARPTSRNVKLGPRPRPGPKSKKSKGRNQGQVDKVQNGKNVKGMNNSQSQEFQASKQLSSIQSPNLKIFDPKRTVSVRLKRFDLKRPPSTCQTFRLRVTKNKEIRMPVPVVRLARLDLPSTSDVVLKKDY